MKNYQHVTERIYRYIPTGQLCERVRVDGKDTCVNLPATTLAEARRVLADRLVKYHQAKEGIGGAVNPYHRRKAMAVTVGECIADYRTSGCPDASRSRREGKAYGQDISRLAILEKFWAKVEVADVRLKTCDDYADWRKEQKRNGKTTKGRAIDLELNTLNCCFMWAERREIIKVNPLGRTRPKYGPSESEVRHCSECRPLSGDELHQIAEWLFTGKTQHTEVLGWQYLFAAMTGVRTSEALRMRWDAAPGKAGYIDDGKFLHLERSKKGVAPWSQIHPALSKLLGELKAWRDDNYPESPWFFPSPVVEGQHVDLNALGHALSRACKALNLALRTPHGARSLYVTIRRSHKIPDNIIAAEIGHTTGGSTLIRSYGAVPQNWYIANHPELDWMPQTRKPAWSVFGEPKENIIKLAANG
jgi:integrase